MALWQRGAGGSTGSPTCGEDLVERRLLRVAAGVLLRLAVQRAFLPVNFALPLNSLTTPDEIIDSRSEPVEDQMSVCLVTTRFHLVGEVQVGNSHPHGKTWVVKELRPLFRTFRNEGRYYLDLSILAIALPISRPTSI